MLVMHREPDQLLPVRFVRLLDSQPVPILSGSIPGLTSVETAGALESETMQLEPKGTVMLAPASV